MGYTYPQNNFYNAQNAFVMLYDKILQEGIETGNGTKALINYGFYLRKPEQREIDVDWRKWSKQYADREWDWYLSRDRSVEDLKKYAPIWDRMHIGDDIVNSNYGYLWSENDQLQKTIDQLKQDPNTRQAWITIFDGKNKDQFKKDTPCTLSIGFQIFDGKLNMTVTMRSNDIWYGFCNDQYCFSKLQELVANSLGMQMGLYYHFTANLHVYEKHYNSRENFYKSIKE